AEIRHQYLHFLLDPLAVKYAAEIHQKESLQNVARPAPGLGADFKEDFSLLVTECLIRAIELRLDKVGKPQQRIKELTASGLILVPYFHSALNNYERQDGSMSIFYKEMILGIDPEAEERRLAAVNFNPPAPPSGNHTAGAPTKGAPASEKERLLNQ